LIVRDYVACETCGHKHTVRIGVGSEKYQPYKFSCKECGEGIGIALDMREGLIMKDNAVKTMTEGTIVNLDSFLLPNPEQTGVDHLATRVHQGHKYLMAQKEHYEKKHGKESFESFIFSQTNAQNITLIDEWKLLKKCWSLHLRERAKLAQRAIDKANEQIYGDFEPLDSFYDWLFRFTMRLGGAVYHDKFEKIIDEIQATCKGNLEFKKITNQLREGEFEEHLVIYFDLFKQFFDGYADFNQVYIYCTVDMDIPTGHQATSQDFDNISQFYGNVFEAHTTLIELLACVNNVMAGRKFDQFSQMTLKKYKKLDKASRCNPLAMNVPLFDLCENIDNQLRNASHHGGFRFNQENGLIKFRTGKGGNGEEQEISYTNYILKSTNLFLALATLLRLELVMCEHM